MRGVCGRALKLPFVREGCVMNEPMITGRQPDSGKPTVRDERGLAETWAMAGDTRARTAETPKQPSLSLRLRAPHFYPTPHPPSHARCRRGVPNAWLKAVVAILTPSFMTCRGALQSSWEWPVDCADERASTARCAKLLVAVVTKRSERSWAGVDGERRSLAKQRVRIVLIIIYASPN